MKTDHIPILSYVFIGVTSLVLTYATIADTTDEVILTPTPSVVPESQSSVFSDTVEKIKSLNPFATTASGQEEIPVAVPESSLPSLSGAIDKIKSLNPFSTSGQEEIPVAVPVQPSSAPAQPMNKLPSSGGKKSKKHRKRKQKKTRRSSK